MAYGTFQPDGEERSSSARGLGRTVIVGALLLGAALVAAVAAAGYTSSRSTQPVVMLQKARQQQLAWSGFTYQMQAEADKALRLCQVGLLGKGVHCAKHVVPTDITKFTNSDEGQNEWAESQRELSSQASIEYHGQNGIGTPGDFGDR